MRYAAIALLIFFLAGKGLASTEEEIRYGEMISFVYSHSIAYEYDDDAISLRLLKKNSYIACKEFTNCKKYRYALLTNSIGSGYKQAYIAYLPEIGDWSVQNVNYQGTQQHDTRNIKFLINCDMYNGNKSKFMFDPELGVFYYSNGTVQDGISYRKMATVIAKRSLIENLDYVRVALKTIRRNKFSIFFVSINLINDEGSTIFHRVRNLADDIILQVVHTKYKLVATSDVRTFIIPSIYFVSVESISQIVEPEIGLAHIRCVLIVQKIYDRERWEYRRLEMYRDSIHLTLPPLAG